MNQKNTFGQTLRELREKKGLTLKAVAEALSIDISMLSKIEKDNRKPSKVLIEKISNFFDVSEKELMIAFLSDTVVYHVMDEEEYADEVFKVAEEKVSYLKTKGKSNL